MTIEKEKVQNRTFEKLQNNLNNTIDRVQSESLI